MGIEDRGILKKRITSSAVITTAGKTGLLYGLSLIGGTTISKLQLKDGGSGGTIGAELSLIAQTVVGDDMKDIMFPAPVVFTTDIYGTISGTNAVGYVYYREIEK